MSYALTLGADPAEQGLVSSFLEASGEVLSRSARAVCGLFEYAREEVTLPNAGFQHVHLTQTHTASEHAHHADHSYEKDVDKRYGIAIALRNYLASLFSFQHAKPSHRSAPDVDETWTPHAEIVRSLGMGQRILNRVAKPKPRQHNHGD